jgi:hypothetical protein
MVSSRAATPTGVRILKLKLPGVFRASIKGEESAGEGEVSWDGERMILGGTSYRPVSFHAEDAEEVARLLTGSS